MQLIECKRTKMRGKVRRTLATLAASLLAASAARAQEQGSQPPLKPSNELYVSQGEDDTQTTGSRAEAGVLYYQESGGRVRAIEPSVNATFNLGDGQFLSLGFVSDTLTGASPNGAVPSTLPQNFLTPIKLHGSTTTATTASGGSTIIQIPPTPGQIAAAAFGRQYTIAPGGLPADPAFHDQRFAGTIGWAQPLDDLTKISIGGGYSTESDYRAITTNASVSRDFNSRNTTASLAASMEFDSSQPYGGTPTPLTSMSPQLKGPNDSRKVFDGVAGLTQIVNRYWLAQLTYSFGKSQGYNTDPYRIISVVDSSSGQPVDYLYENRPRSRTRESVYFDNKVHLGRNTVDASFRYFWDSWSIKSTTIQASDRYAISDIVYVEPQVRWYRQTAASFYRYYLVSGDPLPTYVSSDTRLGKFTGMTYGMKVGVTVSQNNELYVLGQYYKQSGNGHPPNAIGQLAQQNLFAAVSAVSVLVGYSIGF